MNFPFVEITPAEIPGNVFKMMAGDWFLLTAGAPAGDFNTMTAAWGALGVLWNREVSFVFVRPQRYTWNYMEKNRRYTMSFFDEKYRKALEYCGSHSGRDVDKTGETGLTPFEPGKGTTAFLEAKLVLVCRKLYHQDIDSSRFAEGWIDELYPEKGYHRMYVGAIEKVLLRKD